MEPLTKYQALQLAASLLQTYDKNFSSQGDLIKEMFYLAEKIMREDFRKEAKKSSLDAETYMLNWNY